MKYRRGAIIALLLLGTCNEETRQGGESESSRLALGVIPASESAVWQRIGGSSNPDGRHLQAAAFDEDRKVFVMFGGAVMAAMRGQAQPSQEIWEWNPVDGRWSNRTGTGTAPSARSGAAMVYLPDQKKFLLFGGRAGSGFNYEDTWTWDPTTGAWADLTNAGDHPSVRGQHAMVYQKSTKKVLLFGGARGTSSYYTGDEVSVSLGDTWEWDPATGAWSARSVAGGPSARHDVGLVWDSGRDRVVLFGGMSMDIAGATGAVKQDVWEWDPQAGTWTEKTPAGNKPRPRYGHASAFDASRDKTLVFGGVDIDTGEFLNELWEWDGATGTWSERTTTGPSGRARATLVYDATRARLNLVAGLASGTLPTGGTGGYTTIAGMFVGLNEVWELDPATASFSNRTSASDLPSPRAEHSMAYSPSTQTVFVFGGVDMQGRRFSDLWEWNGSKWTALAAVGPQSRSGAGLAYDPRRKTLILFGGTDSSGRTSFNDTWELDTTSKKWIPLKTATLPDALWAHGMVTDTTHGKILVFGGYINGRSTSSKVWEWDGDALTWTDRTPPASSSSPNPRTYPQLAYDEGRQKLFLFDGPAFSTGVSISAFWEWDPVSYGWEQRDPKDQLTKSYLDFAAYDSIRRREVILTNGYDSTGQLQTLELDARKPVWYVRTVANTPSERRNAAMVFDSTRGVVVLFGGTRSDGTYLNETWEYKVTGSGNGVGCTQAFASSCASGNCVEGVCCEAAACTGACKSCNVPELEGTCVLAKAGTEVAGSCSNGQACDGNGNCKSRNGQACSDASACATGLCVDGVCCDSACTGTCASCNNPGQAGKCSPYAAGTDPQNECGLGTGVCKSTCDGVGSCAYPKETRSCGTCLTCDGAGTCSLPDRTCVGGSGGSVRGGSTGTTPIGGAGGAIPMGGAGGAGGGTGRGGSTGTIPSGGGGYVPNGGSVASGGVARGGTVGSGGVGGMGGTVTGRGGSGGTGGTVTGRGGSGGSGGAVSSGGAGGADTRTGGTTGNTSGTGGKRDAGASQGGGSGSSDAGSSVRLNSSGCDCDLGRTGPSATLSSAPIFLAGFALLLRRRRPAKRQARSPAGH